MKSKLNSVWFSTALWMAACGDGGEVSSNAATAPFNRVFFHGSPVLDLKNEGQGEHCENGGVRVSAGQDLNGNGRLEHHEIRQVKYVCNGEDGQDGEDGEDGQDGQDADQVLIEISPEPRGLNCTSGGQKISTGVDVDGSGLLEPSEVSDTRYVCNGAGAGVGVAGFALLSKFTGPGGPVAEIVAAAPDGNLLAFTSSFNQTVGFVDISDPAQPLALGEVGVAEATSNASGEATSVAITPNGQYAVVAVKDTTDPIHNADPGALAFIDLSTLTLAGAVTIGVGPDSLKVTPDGSRVVVAIEDEEDGDNNGVEQARPGSVQIVSIDYAAPSNSTVTTVVLEPSVGNLPSDPQPEYVDITPDGKTAIVSLQENNLVAVIDIESGVVIRYIEAGISVHQRADLDADGEVLFQDPGFVGLLEPDSVCLLGDGVHFVSANEGDTPNENFGSGLYAGGRGFSVFNIDGTRVYDSGDALEWRAVRAGAYTEARSARRGIEIEGCATGVFNGTDYAFLLGERNAALYVVDMSDPEAPVVQQMLGAPMRPEGAVAIPHRNLVVVSGEGNDFGGGIWIYQGTTDASELGHGPDVYDVRSTGTGFGALSALAYDSETGLLLATPDNAFAGQRIWSFWVNHSARRLELVRELQLTDVAGEPLTGYDPEGLVKNPEGGFILASEGTAGNGGSMTCEGSVSSNRLLFFDEDGALEPGIGNNGIVDLPCGAEPNAIDWTTVRGNGFEGVTVLDALPNASGGLKVYAAMQRALTTEGQNTRIAEYDVDAGVWNFYFYTLDPNGGGAQGNTFLSELIHVGGDKFAVVERDQGWAGEALNKTLRTFTLSSGTINDINDPVDKVLVYDLLNHPFRFDQEKIEGLALGADALWVVNDNDGGEALNFFLKLNPSVLGATESGAPPTTPGQDSVVINEVNSQGDDFVELYNAGSAPVDLGGWKITDSDPANVFEIAAGVSIPAGGYLLIGAPATGAAFELGFGLGSSDAVALYTPFDILVSQHAWTEHVASASRCPNGVGPVFWAPTSETPGLENDCTPPEVPEAEFVVINEVNSQGDDFVELYNLGSEPIDLGGWKFTDNDETHVYVIPRGTLIGAGSFLLIEGEGSGGSLSLTFGLGSADSAILYTPFDQIVDQHSWTAHVASTSRCPDGVGEFVAGTPASPGTVNACGL